MLTTAQKTTLAAAFRAEPSLATAVAAGDTYTIADWCNAVSAQDAWNPSLSAKDLFEATDIAKFDNLTAGKRDAWNLMLTYAPVDCSRNKIRKAIEDTWGATDSVAVLQACTRKATNAEAAIGGTSATTNTVTALKLDWVGTVGYLDVAQATNENPV
jgi:hypothetical protein